MKLNRADSRYNPTSGFPPKGLRAQDMTLNLPMNLRRSTRPVRAVGLAVAALLYALIGASPGVAHAQLDDPGLGPAPSSATPAKTPAVTATPAKRRRWPSRRGRINDGIDRVACGLALSSERRLGIVEPA